MDHLKPEIRAIANGDNRIRTEFILNDIWIGYPKGKEVLSKLDFLLAHPRINRMPSLLLVGDTNNGKTVLLRRFEQLKPFLNEKEESLSPPVLYLQAPPVPDEKRLYNTILD